jgi:transcriptional regulator with XRE-family HTH domain
MVDLTEIGRLVRQRRRDLRQTRDTLAAASGVSRARIEALENQRLAEIGYTNLTRILNALGMDFRVTELNRQRPTLEDLQDENTRI